MILANNAVLSIVSWIAALLGFEIDLQEQGIVDSLDEDEIAEQLGYGRD
jgi:hypothetical protein